MPIPCPNCGHINRDGSRFCGRCRMQLPASPAYAPPVVPPGPAAPASYPAPAVPPPPAPAAPAAHKLPRIPKPVVAGSKRGLRFLVSIFTGGGHAAYAEVVGSAPIAEGAVASPPHEGPVGYSFEIAFWLFLLAWPLAFLILILPDLWPVVVFTLIYLALIVLSWAGLRRPFFTTLSLRQAASWLTTGARQTALYQFDLQERQTGQLIRVIMRGPRKTTKGQNVSLQQGHWVRVYGLLDRSTQAIRAWKLEYLDTNWRETGVVIQAPRFIPLTSALFLPVTCAVLWGLTAGVLWFAIQTALRLANQGGGNP